jgi:hypothetical protein
MMAHGVVQVETVAGETEKAEFGSSHSSGGSILCREVKSNSRIVDVGPI